MVFHIKTLLAATTLIVAGIAITPASIWLTAFVLLWWIWPRPWIIPAAIPGSLAVTGLLGFFCFVVFPLAGALTSASRRTCCAENVRQISLAILNYDSAHGRFPPQQSVEANGEFKHSWRILILPYLECEDLLGMYRFDEPWNGPNNRKLHNQMPKAFACPFHPSDSKTIYKTIVGTGTVFSDKPTNTASTIMLMEDPTNPVCWLDPSDLSVKDAIELLNTPNNASRAHSTKSAIGWYPTSSQICFSDGSQNSISPTEGLVCEDDFLTAADFDKIYAHDATRGEYRYDAGGIVACLVYFGLAFWPCWRRSPGSIDEQLPVG